MSGQATCLSHEELVVKHFDETHVHSAGRYKVTLPRRSNAPLLGNSRARLDGPSFISHEGVVSETLGAQTGLRLGGPC